MYHYNDFDTAFLTERNAQFRAQVARRIDGSLTEDEFKPLRLMNGLYLQLHAYMLRVAIPYGTLNSARMRQLAYIAERWDKGYGHFTTRQNIQFNWPKLRDVPDMLDALADNAPRIMATSQSDLMHRMEQGSFRQDLFYRLGGVTLSVPWGAAGCSQVPAIQ